MASHFYVQLGKTLELQWLDTDIENPKECSAHEALFLLRSLARRS